MAIPTLTQMDIDRFWSKVDRRGDDECWLWTASTRGIGYGLFSVLYQSFGAHRIAYTITHGDIPSGLCVCHRCDVPRCVNPAHLFLGTHADNRRDCQEKGRCASGDRHGSRTRPDRIPRGDRSGARLHPERMPRGDRHGSKTHPECILRGDTHPSHLRPECMPRGERNAAAKITTDIVCEIRRLRERGLTLSAIGARFGVCKQTVANVVSRNNWRHVA